MKKIFVPTDFSTCAYYASDVAMALADKVLAEVHFYTRVDVHPLWDGMSPNARKDFPESFSKIQEVKSHFRDLRERYKDSKVRIVTTYSHGDMMGVINRYVDKEDVFMVVMGSSGSSGLKEVILGSNAQKVVKNASCPVMVIKHPPLNMDFKNIVFASDFRPEAKESFKQLIEFAAPFGAHIHLLYIEAPSSFNDAEADQRGNMDEFERMCWKLPCTKHTFGDLNIEMGITHFATDTQADLIAVCNYGRPALQKIFTGSITEALVNHLELPVLTMNTRATNSWVQLTEEDLQA
ncbi:universal stress protein [Pontibacter sp. G13]|uniref:universal stress protein n=1 Tax=Pontibacter sp. G13 TaxID=3074898 RepID=UPI00288B48A2|nr:universal stress protein [Pontibacter sp. G13]WNJ16046.1 universal stress protein [Pontibacter sp. G13]